MGLFLRTAIYSTVVSLIGCPYRIRLRNAMPVYQSIDEDASFKQRCRMELVIVQCITISFTPLASQSWWISHPLKALLCCLTPIPHAA